MTNEEKMLRSPVSKLLVSMSLPIIMVMLVNVAYNMADVFFMGREGNGTAVAAISLAMPVFSIISAFSTLIGFGACTAVSIALGKNEDREVRQSSSFSFYASMLLGFVVMGVLLVCMNPILSILGADAETYGYAESYLSILALGAPFMTVCGVLGNVVRADGDSKSAMVATMTGTVINIALDPLFISVFRWGVRGAALATVAGNIISCAVLYLIIRKKPLFSLSVKDLTFKPSVSLNVLALGLPIAAGTMLMSFSSVFSNRLLVKYGNSAVAANGIAGKSGMLIAMLVMGVCMGIQPAVSYCFGAGRNDRVWEIIKKTGVVCIILGGILAAAIIYAREGFVRSFIEDAEIVELGKKMVIGSVICSPIYGIYQLCSVYLQGTGKVAYATLTTLMRQGLVLIPVLYIMAALFGLNGIVFAAAVSDALSTAVAVVLCIRAARG